GTAILLSLFANYADFFLPNRLSRIAVPNIPAPMASATHMPTGKPTVVAPRKVTDTGVAFCTEKMAIAITKTAGIATTKNFTINAPQLAKRLSLE
ncbi:MAG: hypothetical protein ABG776_06545, partial [Cyanobacteria bacterium J06555_13]